MLRKYFVLTLTVTVFLTGCRALQEKSTLEQVAAMGSHDFTESNGGWSLGLSDSILFDKNDYRLRPDNRQQITTMISRLATTGITRNYLESHISNYGEDSYNEIPSLKRANSIADAWAEGAHVLRSHLATRSFGRKYPVTSNGTTAGCAENRRVTVVIGTP